jgi:pimeloyl-ACP methyl ester carboxylesterase
VIAVQRPASGHLTTPDGARIPYTQIGKGALPVVLILGVDDALQMVDSLSASTFLRWWYSKRGPGFRVLALSRRQPIPPGYSAEQHAEDLLWAIEQMQWGPTAVECLSAGGPVGQEMAVQAPQIVRALILSSCPPYVNQYTRDLSERWIRMAQACHWAALRWSLSYYTFMPNAWLQTFDPFARHLWLVPPVSPLLDIISKPRAPERFERLLTPLLSLDNRAILPRIGCPTLVIGGEDDRVIEAKVQREMAGLIPNSCLKMYPGYGHGNSFVNPDYPRQVADFLKEVMAPTASQG